MRLLFGLILFFCYSAYSSQEIPFYYGSEFINGYKNNSLKNEELKKQLFTILSGGHVNNSDAPDEILPSCAVLRYQEISQNKKCTQHTALGYDAARKKLFGWIHLKQSAEGVYSVKDVYCEYTFTDADFKGELTFGPDLVPKSGNIINTEHTWPQSRFTTRYPKELQKSDLHHLYPTDSQMNSMRSSLRFGDVVEEVEKLKCPQNKIGHQVEGGIIFEVPDSQKGNTARSIFYFATRYQMRISPPEEAALRKWNKFDPVDDEEQTRNNQIESLQGNRNPYIDFPDLVDRIDNFNSPTSTNQP